MAFLLNSINQALNGNLLVLIHNWTEELNVVYGTWNGGRHECFGEVCRQLYPCLHLIQVCFGRSRTMGPSFFIFFGEGGFSFIPKSTVLVQNNKLVRRASHVSFTMFLQSLNIEFCSLTTIFCYLLLSLGVILDSTFTIKRLNFNLV